MNYTQQRRIQPIIKLVPQQPFTNSRLMIYCTRSDKIPINFNTIWYRYNPQTTQKQQIKNHDGSCYECSPLDHKMQIHVTIYYEQLPGSRTSKNVSFPPIKLNRQINQRQLYVMQHQSCKIQIEDVTLDCKVIIKNQCLDISINKIFVQIPLNDINLEMRSSCVLFGMKLQNYYQEVLSFFNKVLGWTPKSNKKIVYLTFNSRVDRDLILLNIHEKNGRGSSTSVKSGKSLKTPKKETLAGSTRNDNLFYTRKNCQLHPRKQSFLDKSDVKSNNNDVPSHSKKKQNKQGKIKISQKMKKPFTINQSTKLQQQFLNIFEDESPQLSSKKESFNTNNPNNFKDSVSMDLRGSFQQFQLNTTRKQSFYERTLDNPQSNKINEENTHLKDQNRKLRQQLDSMNSLAKQNITLKKKYHQLSEEVNRLQIQRKQILEDKLKFQSNYYKQLQEKQYLKKQLQSYKNLLNNGQSNKTQNSFSPFAKNQAYSPYAKTYVTSNGRPITPIKDGSYQHSQFKTAIKPKNF